MHRSGKPPPLSKTFSFPTLVPWLPNPYDPILPHSLWATNQK